MTAASSCRRLRLATPEDQPFLEGLFLAVHRDEFLPLGLPEAELDALLRMQARAQRLSYAQTFPGAVDRIILSGQDERLLGRMLVARGPDAIHLIDIAVSPEEQGRGLGTAALEALLEESRRAKLPVRLQVQATNRAQMLYRRLGFAVTGAGLHLQMEFRPSPASIPSELQPDAAISAEARTWAERIGREYRVSGIEPCTESKIRLHSVVPAPRQPLRCFSLFFRAVDGPDLLQGLYTLRTLRPKTAEPEEHLLFLVPLGPTAGTMQYEAVFNN
jgi:GNAT superfamily N-acetyltransferase